VDKFGYTGDLSILDDREIEHSVGVLCVAFDKFSRKLGFFDTVKMNVLRLETALRRWKLDVYWHGKHHGIDPNAIRQSAFFIHRMVRVKPISLLGTYKDPRYYAINELFTFYVVGEFLEVDLENLNDDIFDEFIYLFSDRDFYPTQLFITLRLLQSILATADGLGPASPPVG